MPAAADPPPGAWDGLRRRDPATFQRLFQEFWPAVLGRARRLMPAHFDQENAAAETMYLAFRNARSFRPGCHPFPWLARICLRVCLRDRSRLRRALDALARAFRHRGATSKPDDGAREATPGWAPSDGVATLRAAMQRLPQRQREAVLLRYLFNVAPREIAQLTKVRPETVRKTLLRGLAGLAPQPGRLRGTRGGGEAGAPVEARGSKEGPR